MRLVTAHERSRVVLGASVAVMVALLRPSSLAAQTTEAGTLPNPQAASATATTQSKPAPRTLSLTGSFDVLNQYMFRGIRQNSTGVAMWPAADLAIAAYSGDGGLKSVSIDIGTWNSLHTGDTGTAGLSGQVLYESDFYSTLTLGFGVASLASTFTAYTSPNDSYSTVKELMIKLGVDDSARHGRGAIKPYVIVAREVDAAPGLGQADGGTKAGTYLEMGVAPGMAGSWVSFAVPVKVGLSLGRYYELEAVDHPFGFVSVAAIVTVPLGPATKAGTWNVHGGGEFQWLGTTTTAFNGGHRTQAIGSVGFGFSY